MLSSTLHDERGGVNYAAAGRYYPAKILLHFHNIKNASILLHFKVKVSEMWSEVSRTELWNISCRWHDRAAIVPARAISRARRLTH